MSHTSWTRALEPKVQGSINLRTATQNEPLDFFIMLASLSGVIGNRAQANYAAANAYQDALTTLCRAREGLKPTTIDLGLVRSVGFANSDSASEMHLQDMNVSALEKEELMALLEIGMQPLNSGQIITGCGNPAMFEAAGREVPFWFKDPRFSHLLHDGGQGVSTCIEKTPKQSIQDLVVESKSQEEKLTIFLQALRGKVAKQLLMDEKDVDSSRSPNAIGIDSLIALELRSWIMRELQVEIATMDISQAMSLQELAEKIAEKSSW
jgi:acyl carrier protein